MEKRVYFKNLSALRFFAAALVILHHIEQYKYWANLPNIWGTTVVDALGHKAVSFFFVLSGFLITYLLLVEDRKSGEINIKNFYVRRILRIWPVYYLIVAVSLFAVPYLFDISRLGAGESYEHFSLVAILLVLVLPNVVRLFAPMIVGANQLWSIGVEEQFYLVWPLLVQKFLKKLLLFLIVFIAIKAVITIGLEIYYLNFPKFLPAKFSFQFWSLLQVEQMAIGAIGAWLLFNKKEKALGFIYRKTVFIASLSFVALLFLVPVHHWWINYAEAVVFIVVILNLSTNPAIRFSMEAPILTTLGNISYGIYMYHTLCIVFCLYALKGLGIDQTNYWLFNILLYSASMVMTLGVAYLSYEYFEKRILEYKEKFMIVKSGNKPTNSDLSVGHSLKVQSS